MGGQGSSVSSMCSRYYHAKIDNCKEIRLALLPPGIATCPQYANVYLQCLQTPALLSRYSIYITEVSFVASHNTSPSELSKILHLAHHVCIVVRLYELRHHLRNIHSHN
jgi:hypothetical protein